MTEQAKPLARLGRNPKYPFATLGIGQAFTIPSDVAPQFHGFRIYVYQRNRIFTPKRFACILQANGDITIRRKS